MIVSHKNCTDGLLAAAIARVYWTIMANKNPEYKNYTDVIFLNPASRDGVFDPDGEILKRFEGVEEKESFGLEPIYFLDLWPTKLKNQEGIIVDVKDWYVLDKSGPCIILDHHASSRPYFESIYANYMGEEAVHNIDKEIEEEGYACADLTQECHNSCMCWFSDRMSGAGLAWKFFFGGIEMPKFIKAAQAADLFEWGDVEHSREIFAGIDSIGFDLDYWTTTIFNYIENKQKSNFMVDNLRKTGKILLENKRKDVFNIISRCATLIKLKIGDKEWDISCCNSSFDQTSIGEEMNERWPDIPALIYYYDKSGAIKGSMRSKHGSDVDVRQICELIGGGGHKNASGFRIEANDAKFENKVLTIETKK